MSTPSPRVIFSVKAEEIDRIDRAAKSEPEYRGNRSEFIRDAVFRRVKQIERKKSATKEAA